ncbi:MAG: NAD(P)H-quinone oxidoreductase subunit F [Oscillatoriales cyanobacterium SM2_1_8]|nr:NAD(P)H-quinone oxidoreductase subunit F [Oscillatoriales cyanobacterium SM2_1_8]
MNGQAAIDTVWLVPLYGLLGALLTLPWSLGWIRRSGQRPAAYINLLMTLVGLVHSAVLLWATFDRPAQILTVPWFRLGDWDWSLALSVSAVSAGASLLIAVLSLCAQTYGLASMDTDWSLARFYALMGFFEGALSGVALSDSLLLSYGLLELLTVSTYLLVGFWYAQPLVVTAARDAFWTKRVGDLFLLMGIVALSALAGSLNFEDLAAWAAQGSTQEFWARHPVAGALLGLALMAGPTGKCAQVPLHLWLDEAMEGPNPASVMRNSVVVAAGAYVLVRLTPVLDLFPATRAALVGIGAVTAVGASLVAIAQVDIKRALSHGTSAYLGLVFVAVGMNEESFALSFLLTHGLARGLLFMSTGAIAMTTMTQDLTEMGGIGGRMPATALAFLTGAAGTVALLPLGNFWTLLDWGQRFWQTAPALVGVLLAVNGATAFGLTRIFALVFLGQPQPKTHRTPEVGWLVAIPLLVLVGLTLHGPLMLAGWQGWPATVSWPLVSLLVGSGGLGVLVAWWIYVRSGYAPGSAVPLPPRPLALFWKSFQDALAYDLYVVPFYRRTVVAAVAGLSRLLVWSDRRLVDGLVNWVGTASVAGGDRLKYTVSGQSQTYVLTIVVGLVLGMAFILATGR